MFGVDRFDAVLPPGQGAIMAVGVSKPTAVADKDGYFSVKSQMVICCMVIRVNLDCNSCCRKMRRNILNMKEIEKHLIEKQQNRVSICGRFKPADVAIKLRKKMNRRVEILEIEEMTTHHESQQEDPTINHYKY